MTPLPMILNRSIERRLMAFFVGCACVAACAQPQAPSPPEPVRPPAAQPVPDSNPVAPLAWLAGCWQGNVNQRDFREEWLPYSGGMLVGAGQQVMKGTMQDYEYLRIEARAGAVFFSQFGADRKETSFRLESTATDEKDTIFTFANTAPAFPARLVYRRGTEGWLYETIEGQLAGSDKKVIYPLRRVDCESGELITE